MLLKGSLVSFGVLPNHIFNYLSVRLGSFNVTGLLCTVWIQLPYHQTSRSWRLFRNVPVKNGYSYLNVLVHFGETSQTAAAKNN